MAGWGLLGPTAPQAATLDAVIAVDNIFNFFLGDSTGSNLRYIGQGNDWFNPLSLTEIACQPGDFIYVAGWDDGGAADVFGPILSTQWYASDEHQRLVLLPEQ